MDGNQKNQRMDGLLDRLDALDAERLRILSEIEKIKAAPAEAEQPTTGPLGFSTRNTTPQNSDEKVALFLKLFRCRESIYPKRWENRKTGKQGYSPVCSNEWKPGICEKPKIKCAECKSQAFRPLGEAAAEAHLKGLETIGTYAIREDDSTIFLACDFDGDGWQDDITAYRTAGQSLGIEIAVERSRSGNGGHAWIFFVDSISARDARLLGTLILSRSEEARHEMKSSSYDRFFPNQDILPDGGFGNLIALPLQKKPREQGNSIFLDTAMNPIADQWAYLASIRRLRPTEVADLLRQYIYTSKTFCSDRTVDNDYFRKADETALELSNDTGKDLLKGRQIEIGVGAQVEIPLLDLPSRVITRLKRTASFANPEFYKRQRMRRQTYPEPRFIFSGELRPELLLLPRGCLDKAKKILTNAGAEVMLRDERLGRKRLKVEFVGQLKPEQESAIEEMFKHDSGILSAPPGAGKTVMGCALIARRKVTTLVLVHRQQILDQWKESLQKFLKIEGTEIGTYGGGSRKKPSGKLDLAMLPTLTKKQDLSEIAENYSQIIVDEAHHVPAASFEGVMKMLPARYVVGLTATPYRKDGLEKILFQQCGPIRHTIESTDGGKLAKTVQVRETGFRLSEALGPKPAYHALLHSLVTDLSRNKMIAKDVVATLQGGHFPLLISDRKDHLDLLEEEIKSSMDGTVEIVRLEGGMGKKERSSARMTLLDARDSKKPTLLMATASLIGEGFDLPELDTLILATPLSFKGRMVQYAGRLHRLVEGKENVKIFDYLDSSVAMLLSMYRKRVIAYQGMNYSIEEPENMWGPRSRNLGNLLFQSSGFSSTRNT